MLANGLPTLYVMGLKWFWTHNLMNKDCKFKPCRRAKPFQPINYLTAYYIRVMISVWFQINFNGVKDKLRGLFWEFKKHFTQNSGLKMKYFKATSWVERLIEKVCMPKWMKNSRQPHLSKQNFPRFFERKFFTPILSCFIQTQRISWEINIKTSLTKATQLDT